MLLSRTLKCSTIAAEVLNVRVRDGNGCDNLAKDTEKTLVGDSGEGSCRSLRESYSDVQYKKRRIGQINTNLLFTIFSGPVKGLKKKVVKPHGLLVLVT